MCLQNTRAISSLFNLKAAGNGGVSTNTVASTVLICKRQDGSLVQQDSVANVGSNFKSLTLASLF